jgi:spermidine synthase
MSTTATLPRTITLSQIRPLMLLLFFLSGASALIYEVAWVRMLSLGFGVSVYAVSAVLTAFMGGLALGSWLFGKLVARDNTGTSKEAARPLQLYAYLQLGVALAALASPLVFAAITNLYASLDQTGTINPTITTALRFGLAILALIIPTTLMGGTLPLIAQLLAGHEQDRGLTLGALYSANTFGAVLGTFVAGFILIRFLGTTGTLMVAAAGDLITVAVAWWLASAGISNQQAEARTAVAPVRKQKTTTPRKRQAASLSVAAQAQATTQAAVTPQQAQIILVAFSISGFVALAYQVIWTRTLAIFSLNAVYSFSVMLATFLAGLAIGGALMARRADRLTQPLAWFGLLQLGIGLSAILAQFVFARLPTIIERFTFATDLAGALWAELLPALLTMLLPTLLLGATFPIAARIYTTHTSDVGRNIGRLYAGNTLGAMVGSLTAGFVLIPQLGLQNSVLLLALLNGLNGILALSTARPHQLRTLIASGAMAAIGLIAAFLLPPGVFLGFREGVTPQLKFYQEGVDATVAVMQVDNPPLKVSFVNGRNEVPTDPQSMRAFYLLGHLPPLLRPDANEALVVSFGNGIATGSLAQHPLKQITAVELVSGQVEAARQLYTSENRNVLADPRLRIVHEDGRNFLLRDTKQYDIITADATHPINSSSWALFTQEFYQLVDARLAPDGVFIQWLPFHDLQAEDYRTIVATFRSVFPNTSLFYTGGIHTFLVATAQPLTRAQLAALEPAMQQYSAASDLGSAAQLADDLLLDSAGVGDYTATARIITDNNAFFLPGKDERTILESFAPYALR